MSDQIGTTGNAKVWGVPATTVTFNAHTLTIFTDVEKTMDADIDPTVDNSGERLGQNRRNKRIGLKFSAHPIGANAAAAQVIAADLPNKGDAITITCSNDSQIASGSDTVLVDSASARYTPEGELVVDFTATKWLSKAFIALS
jgi:hypothetical protein